MKYLQLVKAIDAASQQLLGRAAAVVNQSLVIRNWLVGAYIVEFEQRGEDRAKYGSNLLKRLANDLQKRAVKGLSVQMLERTRHLYFAYPQLRTSISSSVMRKLDFAPALQRMEKSSSLMRKLEIASGSLIPSSLMLESFTDQPEPISAPLVRKSAGNITPLSTNAVLHFSWTQLIELIRIDDPLKRAFYENECLKGNWSVRQLQRQIGSLLFERTGLSKNKAAVLKRAQAQSTPQTIADLIRDPYVLEFTGLGERPEYTESDLETALLNHLQKFLLELGAGFLFEARQRRITVGREHDYIDLVFYHRHLRCHVLLDLKVRAFKHGDAGQMNFYLNWWRENVTASDEQPPVGILLCSDKDHTKVQFATAGMDNKLFVSRYLTMLPSAEQLQRFVEADRDRIEAAMKPGGRARPEKPRRKKKGKAQKRRATGNFQ
jgi:predicted nuclease of restriction endonuclease-like (RecB) superfamily